MKLKPPNDTATTFNGVRVTQAGIEVEGPDAEALIAAGWKKITSPDKPKPKPTPTPTRATAQPEESED